MPSELTYFRPPGWASIDIDPSAQRQLDAAVTAMVRDVPQAVRPQVTRQLTDDMQATLEHLTGSGAFRLLFPSVGALTQPVRPVVALAVPDAQVDQVETIVAIATTDTSATMLDLPGRVGIKTRSEHDTSDEIRTGVQALVDELGRQIGAPAVDVRGNVAHIARHTVRLRYHLGVPGEADAWLTVFVTFGHDDSPEGREVAELTEALLDEWVATVRWTDVP